MKNKIGIFVIITYAIAIIYSCIWVTLKTNPIIFAVNSEMEISKEIKPHAVILKAGQIWGSENDGKENNPFDKKEYERIRQRVLAVKDGYVKYCYVGHEKYGNEYTFSEKTSSFG